MNELSVNIKLACGCLGGVLGMIFGECDELLISLLIFIVFDLLTGFMKGAINHKLDSRVMKRGIVSKAFEMLIVVIAVRLDLLTGQDGIFRNMAVLYYIATECLSILENVGEFIDLPSWLGNFLQQLKDINDKEKDGVIHE